MHQTNLPSLTVDVYSLANVAGTQEPEYGPSAIRSVAEQAQTVPFTELTSKDLKWKAMESTCVETQIFYFMADDGTVALVQVLYSNVRYLGTISACKPWADTLPVVS